MLSYNGCAQRLRLSTDTYMVVFLFCHTEVLKFERSQGEQMRCTREIIQWSSLNYLTIRRASHHIWHLKLCQTDGVNQILNLPNERFRESSWVLICSHFSIWFLSAKINVKKKFRQVCCSNLLKGTVVSVYEEEVHVLSDNFCRQCNNTIDYFKYLLRVEV